jgi:hypothetical protein
MLGVLQAVPGEQSRHGGRGQEGQPGLAALGGGRPDQLGVGVAGGVPQVSGQHVVGDEFCAWCEAGDRGEGLFDGRAGEVHGDAEPADERRLGGVESAWDEAVRERLGFEIDRDEGYGVRYRDLRGRQEAALPLLGRGVVGLEDPDPTGQLRSVGERVKAGAENHVLRDAAGAAAAVSAVQLGCSRLITQRRVSAAFLIIARKY